MFVPPQGFRHAAVLLLTNRARGIPPGASSEEIRIALGHLAHELVALAEDTHAPPEASEWLVSEFNATIDRLPQSFDRLATKSSSASILARVASRVQQIETRDLFLVYAPEDRLPVAAPLAVELTKRRVSVAFSEYEVVTPSETSDAVVHGLASHRGGVVLCTKAFERAQSGTPLPEHDRVRILRHVDLAATVADLAKWVHILRLSKP
jgi:hypothetical protein